MLENWRDRAACRGLDSAMFFVEAQPGEPNHGTEAKRVCVQCDVQIECLDFAIRTNERYGIWGGIGLDRRQRIRAVFVRGDALTYERSLRDEVENTARAYGIIEDERPILPERDCERCGSRVRAGRHPVDRNGPNATCGRPSTYNKGCRCDECVRAKLAYMKRRPSPPRAGSELSLEHDDNPGDEGYVLHRDHHRRRARTGS